MIPKNKNYSSVPQSEDAFVPSLAEYHFDEEEFELQSLNSADHEELQDLEHEADTLDPNSISSNASEDGKSSMRMAFMNMANSILGAGIIGQPYAFKNSGLVGGIVVLLILTVLIDWTLRLIVMNATLSNTHSYQDTVNFCYGRYGKIILLVAISSFAYGGCMAFCVIIGDTIPHVLKAFIPKSITGAPAISWLFHRNSIIVIFTTCTSYPLSLNRDILKLAKASGFALVGMLVIVLITLVRGPMADKSLKSPLTVLEWTVNVNIFQGISVISFALVCHHNTIFIYNSMERATISKFSKLTHIACIVSMVCCLVMGVNGLVTFGDNTKGNVLNNFKSDDNWVNVARFCFGLNMLTTFPLEVFVVRDVLKDILFSIKYPDSQEEGTSHMELTSRQHFFITTFIVFSTMSVALFTCNLGIILELIGSTSASLMAYIIPPLCYLKLKYDASGFKSLSRDEKKSFILWTGLPTIGCTIFGFLVMFISSFMSIRDSVHETNAGHCVEA